MKAVILARVSSKEQEEGHSIAAQRQRLIDYCERKNLEVIEVFEMVESSTRGDRKQFQAMLSFATEHKETIAIVADAIDRFQRSFSEQIQVDELWREGEIELHFHRDSLIINRNSSAADILRWDYGIVGAKAYTLNLSENVRRSLEFKRRNGEWGGTAPIGYLNCRDERGKADIIPDPERAFLIQRLFTEYATGCFSISGDMLRMTREWNLTNKTRSKSFLSQSQIHQILQNPFYYGEMVVKGKTYPHRYERLITKELFDKCHEVRVGTQRPQAVRTTEKPFVLRGLRTALYQAGGCPVTLKSRNTSI